MACGFVATLFEEMLGYQPVPVPFWKEQSVLTRHSTNWGLKRVANEVHNYPSHPVIAHLDTM